MASMRPVIMALAALAAGGAHAADAPALSFEVRDTADFWRNVKGGLGVGDTTLNKLQAAATLDGEALGRPGFRAYVQVFRTNAESLSLSRTGDIQTASNIEAPRSQRLFELWAEQSKGQADDAGWIMGRAGLIDLNRAFDSIAPAGLFLNSSHGIGPDLSKSGVSGPSIFPVTGLAAQVGWRPVKALALNAGVFAEPDPTRQRDLADLPIRHGAIAIGQADWTPAKDVQVSLGVWRYTVRQASVADSDRKLSPRPGVYAFVQGPAPLPGAPQGWIRAGAADGRVQQVAGYLGAGLVWKAPGRRRDRDQLGVAVAHALIARPARRALGLPAAETTIEATYSYDLGKHLHLQPDIQHIIHPAAVGRVPDATVIGLRIVTSLKSPAKPPETSGSDSDAP